VSDRPPEGAPGTSLLFDVFATSQAVGRLLAAAMRGSPLTPSEYAVASAIFELEAATPTALAARLGMPLTTFADHLRAFQARGLAARLPHPTDGRSYRVVLTAAGREAHKAANAGFEEAHRAFAASLPANADQVRAALAAIRDAAESAGEADEAARVSPPPSRDRGG